MFSHWKALPQSFKIGFIVALLWFGTILTNSHFSYRRGKRDAVCEQKVTVKANQPPLKWEGR